MKQVISLDFWGTVVVFNPEYAKARTAFLAELFELPSDEAHARYQYIKRKCDYDAEHFGTAVSPLVAVKRLLEGQKTTRVTNAVEVLDAINQMVRDHPPLIGDGILGSILELTHYKGFIVGLSSNTNFIRGQMVQDLLGFDVAFSVNSDEIGVSKPDPDFYRMVRKAGENCGGSGFLHIGDNSVCDVRGAQRAGMQAMLTKSPKETVRILDDLAKRGYF